MSLLFLSHRLGLSRYSACMGCSSSTFQHQQGSARRRANRNIRVNASIFSHALHVALDFFLSLFSLFVSRFFFFLFLFSGIRGLLVLLDDTGALSLSYLGTSPPSSSLDPAAAGSATTGADSCGKELDYEAMDSEHRTLLKFIREATTGDDAWGVRRRRAQRNISSKQEEKLEKDMKRRKRFHGE